MSFNIFLIELLVCGVVTSLQSASVSNNVTVNETKVSGRSPRTYDDPQRYVSIPIGYFKPEDQDSASTENEDDSSPKYNVPTSFDDFMPSDKSPRKKYPMYYKSKGESHKGAAPNWKGDSANGNISPAWLAPSPADMAMMMNMMKGVDGDVSHDVPDGPIGLLSKLTFEPIAFIGAIMLPVAILMAAALPTLISLFNNNNSGDIPTVTTVATGNNGRKQSENPSFVMPILEAIENFKARGASEHTCLQKNFCEATRGTNGTDFRPIQKSIYKAFTFVDDYWLEALGIKQLMEALGNGNCDKIHCDTSKEKETDAKQKRV